MPNADPSLHLYQRAVDADSDDSLSIIARFIEPGQTLLDLGMGTGGLGQYLNQRHAIVADGVTLNEAEANIARAWYRQVVVADLDRDQLDSLFGDQRYDCIVCADVLEHLKTPQNLLAQCKALLKPGGRLIASVPNAGYCGLVAELITGDFRYRSEGLLDETHLRFFTRTSLQRFFAEQGWRVQSMQTTQRNLLESEFRVAFDSLPPAVARHLLALPDALTYQFISVLQPAEAAHSPSLSPSTGGTSPVPAAAPVNALFSAELYLAVQNQYSERTKLVSPGRIGDQRQTLSFDIPVSPEPYTHVRLDPADRPGFFRLHHLHLRLPGGELAWQWQDGSDPLTTLANAPHNQILFALPWEMAAGALLLLHGNDPWLELPLSPGLMQSIARSGARLEVCAGWPMSADYLQASTTINTLQATHQQTSVQLQQEVERISRQLEQTEHSRRELQTRLDTLSHAAQDEKQALRGALRWAQREHTDLAQQAKQITLPQPVASAQSVALRKHPVDIIVPVFRGFEDTRCCLESVLAAPCLAAWRLIVINDCSPEPEVTEWLRSFARRDARIVLLENPTNMGFVESVNRGMALSQQNDVLLLNSDTEVSHDWLDRLQRAAYSQPRVASVTPFSNNATLCSYPGFCQASELPNGQDCASLDQLFAQQLAGQTLEIPTGVGFCMYVRRQCLLEIGLFDVINYGQGYGEENDFCVRAQQAGWIHLHALDTFVRHVGGSSFGSSKSERELKAMETLRRLHPGYESAVHDYIERDPARAARLRIDLARITTRGRPVILSVMHNREGGTLRHVQELARQLGGQATFLRLAPAPGGVELRLEGAHEAFALHFALPQQHAGLLQTLRQLQVGHIHYHHLLDHAPEICELPAQLGVSHDFTVHDYYSYCPQITLTDHNDRYCEEKGMAQCRQCLQRRPAPGGESIESWRARHARLLDQARYLITPSFDAAQRMQRFVPNAHIQLVPHASLYLRPLQHPKPRPRVLASGKPLKIVVLGALSKIKGCDTLEEVATLSAIQNLDLEFHLIGYPYRSLRALPASVLTLHGGYHQNDLPQLLQALQADVVWFPALWPETYSYTLSASLEAGLPVVAPNLGAFAERLQNRDWSWLCDWHQSAGQWLEFFITVRQQNFCRGVGPGHIPILAQPMLPGVEGQRPALVYANNYLEQLPQRGPCSAQELVELEQQIDRMRQAPGTRRHASDAIKFTTLRALTQLRSSPALAPLRSLVPMHLQHRLKLWLGN